MTYYTATFRGRELSLTASEYSRGHITCPECGGSGKDNDSLDHDCYTCHGLKRLFIHKEKDGKLTLSREPF